MRISDHTHITETRLSDRIKRYSVTGHREEQLKDNFLTLWLRSEVGTAHAL